jgi:AAA domain/DnaB-like helicase N terminal domain
MEQALCGALLQDAQAAGPELKRYGVTAQHCEDPRNAAVLGAIAVLIERGEPVDVVTVLDQLESMGAADRAGGLEYVNALYSCVPSARNAGRYAELVVERAAQRRIATLALAVATSPSVPQLRAELLAELQRAPAGAPAASTIPLEWAADMPNEIEARPQMVEGLFNIGDLAMIYGASNSGKSYFAGHMSMCITEGADFLGRRTKRGAVLYVAGEGPSSIRQRLAAYRRHFGREPGRFGLIPCALDLMEPSADVGELARLVVQAAKDIEEPVLMIVIDTVARAMVGGDENTGVDMARLVGACDRIRAETGATLLLIHHAGKDESRGARGHSSLRAALDTEIEVSKDDATKTHYAKVTKQRDLGGGGEKLAFKLVPVHLSTDEWCNPVTACAVVAEECQQQGAGPRRLTPAQQAVLAYLAGHKTGAKRATLVSALEPQGVARASVYRAVNELLNGGIVVEVAGQVYLPKESA